MAPRPVARSTSGAGRRQTGWRIGIFLPNGNGSRDMPANMTDVSPSEQQQIIRIALTEQRFAA
jgi:hypothetical protein